MRLLCYVDNTILLFIYTYIKTTLFNATWACTYLHVYRDPSASVILLCRYASLASLFVILIPFM